MHDPFEYTVDRIYDLSAASEVTGKVYLHLGRNVRILLLLAQEQIGSCLSEAVDALLDVAYREPVVSSYILS